MKKEYKGKEAQLDSELVVEFESDRITIDVPLEGTDVEGGWKILPLAPPVVCCQISIVPCLIISMIFRC